MSLAAGEAYWAIVPFTPEAPFKIHVSDAGPVEVNSAAQIVDGLRKGGDAELGFVVRAKARPVLLLSGRSDPRTGDLFALRLLRLSEISEHDTRQVREQRDPLLFHLRRDRFPDLPVECAAMLSAPIRMHETALDTRQCLGRLDRNELRVLTERFVSYWQLDLHQLLLSKIRELARRQAGR